MNWIVAGLGNPGAQYDRTRHNVGFETIDLLAARWKIKKIKKLKFQSLYAVTAYNGVKVTIVKPQTFMNESGRALRLASDFYKVPPTRVVVVYDDVNLPLGRLRIRPGGSDGGHNGMKSILYHLQSAQFPRIRIGVGAPPGGEMVNWVLGGFPPDQRKTIDAAIKRAAEAVETLITQGIETAMNRYNREEEAQDG